MAFSTFRDWGERIFARFPKMKREYEARLIYGIGYTADKLVELANFAVAVRHVQLAPEDALPYHGRDRRLVRGPDEPAATFRARLLSAWDAWSQAGSEAGLLAQLDAYLGTTGTFVLESQGVSYPPRAAWWSRFWVVIPEDSHSFSGSVSSNAQEALRRIVRQFRPAHCICERVTVIESGRIWHPWPTDGRTFGTTPAITFGDTTVHHVTGSL
jgi:hypothetical protein